ncbi:hypothetical protein FRB98_005942 [Tulasnella sp. 332]|nr:hypothetical protein FRB98_005942 [Tulasnella sp. 332]
MEMDGDLYSEAPLESVWERGQSGIAAMGRGRVLASACSSNAVMDSLPADLIGELFELVLNDHPGTRRTEQLTKLRLVAKRWNRFLETFPSAWAEIDLTDPPQSMRKHLQLSSDCPLAVVAPSYLSPAIRQAWTIHARELEPLLLGDTGRVQTLYLAHSTMSHPSFIPLLPQLLPALKHVHFEACQSDHISIVAAFLSRHIHQLQTLSMDVTIGWGPSWKDLNEYIKAVSHLPLKHLGIIGSWDLALSVVTKTSNLTSLSIVSASVLDHQQSYSPSIMTLPHLRTLKLDAQVTDSRLVFDYLRMPQLEEVRVVMADCAKPANLSHLLNLIVLGKPPNSPVSMALFPGEVKIPSHQLLIIFEVSDWYYDHEAWNRLDQAAEEAFKERSVSIYLGLSSINAVYGRLKRLSAFIAELVLGHLIEWDTGCRMLERKEKYCAPDGTWRVRWIFPKLRCLTLSPVYRKTGACMPKAKFIVDVLRARSSSPAGALQTGESALRISIRFVSRATYDELMLKVKEDLLEVASEVIVGWQPDSGSMSSMFIQMMY